MALGDLRAYSRRVRTLQFFGYLANDAEVVHSFDLGGGAATDPAGHEPDDCVVWVEPDSAEAVLAVAAGMGNAIGHLESYYDASNVARLAAGYAVGRVSARPLDIVLPDRGSPEVLAAAKQAHRTRGARATLLEAIADTANEVPGLAKRALEADRGWLLRGMAVELALALFQDDTLSFAQRGAIALYRSRSGRVESVAPLGTLREDYIRAGLEPAEDAPGDIVTHLISAFEPWECSTLTVTTDIRVGDVFLFATRGVHEVVDADEIAACMAHDADAIPELLARLAQRRTRRRHQPTSAVIAVR